MRKRFFARDTLAAAISGLALVLVALGAGSRGRVGGFRFTHGDAIGIAIALAVLAVASAVLAVVTRRFGRPRVRQLLAGAAILGLLALVALLFTPQPGNLPARHDGSPAPTPTPPKDGVGASSSIRLSTLSVIPLVIGAVIVAVVLASVVVMLRRRRRPSPPDGENVAAVAYAAIDAGAGALHDVADPRQAIIACYAAMEQALASAGVRRLAAETPSDLLSRLADHHADAAAHEAARRLTALFLEARFSSHPMSSADRETARALLAQLREPAALADRVGPAAR